MAANFNLTAQINLRGPSNLKPIVANIRRQLGTVNSDINLNINSKAIKSIDSATNRLNAMNKVLVDVRSNAASLNQSFRDLASSLGAVQTSSNTTSTSVAKTSQNVEKTASKIKVARTEMEEFGRQAALAIRRFAAFSVVTSGVFALTNAITGAFKAFIDFDRELVRLQQVTGSGAIGVRVLQNEITNLATSLGVSSAALTEVTTTLAQAGLNIEETRIALAALAKTELAPSFENLTKTTEGAIAAIRQFGLEAGELEAALGSINAVAAAYAVESGDIIAAIQRTGGVFASASKGVSEGTDALNEFIAIFTSVRQTTRESAETIATGLRTIFTRIQRSSTIELLKQFGVQLQDVEGKFVGPFEAIKRLSEALNQLDPRDIRFSSIVEELGGFRQIGKVIPLIQQFAVAQEALGVAQRGQSSLTDAQVKAQQSLANQIAKVREQFLALIRDIGQSSVFQGFFKIVLGLTSGLISLASAFKPILPILAVVGAIKGVSAIGQFATGFFGGLKKGGGAGGTGQNIGESLSGAKEKQRAEATAKAADATKLNTDALKTLTSAVQSLDSTIRSRGSSTLSGGGKVLGFNRGGVVPGSGKGDKVPAMLEPGEVVMSNQAAQKYGRGNLASMNKYAWGGKISSLTKYYKSLPNIDKAGYAKISDQKIIDRSVFKEVKPTDLTTEEILDWRGDSLPRWKKFENLLSNKYNLGQPSNYKFGYLDFPKTRSEAKFMKLGDTYQDADTLKGNNPGTIAGKNFLFANSKGTNKRPSSLSNIQISETPVTTYWADPSKFDKAALKSGGGLIKKFMAGSPGGVQLGKGRGKPGRRGARDTFKELDETELANLSTKDLIDYAKEQAYRIFSTAGAGMVVGNEFIEVPQERIIPELESELTTYLGKRGFWREVVEPFGSIPKTRASIQRKMDARTLRKMVATAGGVDSSSLENVPMDVLLKYAEQAPRAPKNVLEATIARYQKDPSTKGGFLKRFEQSAKSGEFISGKPLLDEIPDIPERLVAFRKSLEKELSETQDEKLRKSVLDKIVKTNNAIQEAKDYQKDILPTVTGRASHFAWAMRQAIPESKNFANGGLVQQFMAGSVGGVETPVGKISQDILDRIQKVGGSSYITANVAYDQVQKAVAEARALVPKVGTPKQLLTLPSLKSLTNGSLLEEIIEPLLSKAEEIKEAELAQQAGQKQLNEQAAAGKGFKFGLASLYGPNGQLGYSSITNAKELLGKDGTTKYLTQIVRKSLPNRYADAVSKIQKDVADLPARGAEQFQYTDIFGAMGPLAFDFDDTLVKGADIFSASGGIDTAAYSDLDKVREALRGASLTRLGKELAKRLIDYPELMDNIRVLTARPQSNAELLASKLSSLGLPIPASKITGVSGGLNKVNNLAELETLIDDSLENIGAVSEAGKLGYLYREPQAISAANQSSQRAIAAIEGYDLEEIVKQLGVGISSDDANPLRPIDYPNGLGFSAKIWGFDPKMPTDTKRTNDGSAVSRLWAEAQKYIVQNFAFGGKADGPGFEEVRQAIIDKYPDIEFRISKRKRGFGYNLMGALKSAGGLSGDTSLNFQQPTNLKQLQEYSDKLANKLMNPEQLAVGGSPSGESIEEIGSDPLLEKLRKKKESGILGKVGLRSSQSEVTATYFKNSSRSGMVTAKRLGDVFSVGLSNATGGFGPYLYEIVMEKVSQLGSMLTPDRSQVSQDAQGFWQKAFSRSSIRKTPLDPKYWTKNSALLDPKLYGKPETWPPADDPAWILQSGYSKNPDFINSSDVIDLNDPKYAAFIQQQQLAFLSRKNGGKSIQLAGGGTVPAMVSNQEGFVPPKLAKRIGYAKLDRMNQADRNGMTEFAGGGISKFKGPGSGTSDSIGPIGLPKGSYVIRAKAMKAMNLNKGGAVGVQYYKKGTPGGVPKSSTEGVSSNIVSNFEAVADSLGLSMYELAQKIKETASIARDAALAQGKSMEEAAKAAESATAALLGLDQTVSPGEAPLEGKSFDDITTGQKKSTMSREAIKASGQIITNVETRRAARQKAIAPEGVTVSAPGDAAAAKAATKGFRRKDLTRNMRDSSEGVENIINTYNEITTKIAEAEAKIQELTGKQVDMILAGEDTSEIDKQVASTRAEAQTLKSTRTSKAAAAGVSQGVETDVGLNIVEYIENFEKLNETIANGAKQVEEAKKKEDQANKNVKAARAKLIQEQMKGITGGTLQERYAQAKKEVEAGNFDPASEAAKELETAEKELISTLRERQKAENDLADAGKEQKALYGRSTNIEDSLESSRRVSGGGDPFYEAKKAAEASAAGVPGMPKVNPQIAQEQADYLRFKAEQAGMSVSGYKYSMAQTVGKNQYDVRREMKFGQQETKNLAAGRARELKGVDVRAALKEGNTSEEAKKVQAVVEELAASIQKANPAMGLAEAREQAAELAEKLSAGDKSVQQVIESSEALSKSLNSPVDEAEVLAETLRRSAAEMGVSVETLRANVSPEQMRQQAFIQSTDGKRFGALAEFAPGLTKRISDSRAGAGLASLSDFAEGKGGKFSKLFARAGGITGVGAGIATGVEAVRTYALPDNKDPNVAGALGGLSGAAAGAATGYQLGGGGIPGVVAAGIGAIVGGVKGFFDAKNAQVLNNALEKLTKTSEDVDKAFKQLALNDTDANFKNVQEAFGAQIAASKELDAIAFGGGGEGPSAAGTGGSALFGAGIGAAIGTYILPGIGTAIGAALGGVIGGVTGYIAESQSKANRQEALTARAGQAGAMNEAAVKSAERQVGRMSIEELAKKDAAGINILAEQYSNSAIAAAEAADKEGKLTAKQKEKIGQNATETAYLDAYMKQRKEAGATDEQISKDIIKDRKVALQAGKEALDAQNQAFIKQQNMLKATKELTIATENLFNVYRRISAEAEKYSNNLQRFSKELDATLADIGGSGNIRDVDRQNEEILANVSAFSEEEVRAAAGATAGFLGNTPEAQNLANQAVAQKLVQDRIPALLRSSEGDPKAREEAFGQIEQLLSSQGLDPAAIRTIVGDLEQSLTSGGGRLTDAEIQEKVAQSFSTVGKGLEQLQNVTKKYNDALQEARNIQNRYNKTLSEAQAFFVKASQIRLNAEIDLAKALGRSPTLQQLNEPFDLEISSLTSGLVQSGSLAAQDAGDPMAILAAMNSIPDRIKGLEDSNKQLFASAANIPEGAAGDPLRQKLNSEQLKNIESIASLTEAQAQGRKALERLANDGTKAANALAKIQEEQQAIEGFGAFAEKVFTAEPQELAQMEIKAVALNAAQVAGPEFFKSRQNRQNAFAGLEQKRGFMTRDEYNQTRASLVRKSYEAQGVKGTDVVERIAGKDITLDELEKRLAGGVDEQDPNVIAFREATAIQAAASDALGLILTTEADKISQSMVRLETFLSTDFRDIMRDALTKSQEDTATKPPVKAKEEPQKPSYAETRVTEGEAKVTQGEQMLQEARDEREKAGYWIGTKEAGRINTKERKAREMIAAGRQTVAQFTPIAEKDKEIRAAQAKEAEESKKKAETEAKARQTEENKAKAEGAIDRAIKTREGDRPNMVGEGGQRVVTQTGSSRPIDPVMAARVEEEYGKTELAQIRAEVAAPVTQETPTVDSSVQKRREEEVRARQSSIGSKTAEKTEKEAEIAKKENRFKAARAAASAAGTLRDETGAVVNPNVLAAEEALNLAKQDLVSINEQITAEKQRLAAIAELAKLEEQGTQPSTNTTGGGYDPNKPLTPKQQQAADQINRNLNNTSVTNYENRLPTTQTAPVPVTAPRQVSYTNQQAASTTTQTTQTPTEASVINISPESLKGLETFNTTFATYVDRLVTFEFPTIPDVIEMKGNHVVDVRISGAAAFEGLKKDFESMMQKEIKKAMGKIWGQSGGQMGDRPDGTAP